jgi:hypothetical protein
VISKQKSPFLLRIGFILCKRLWRIKITPLTPAYRQAGLPSPLLTAGRKAHEERDVRSY